MTYYDALIAKWATLAAGTTDAKLAEINALTAPGPDRPVPIADVSAMLRTSGAWLPIKVAAAAGTSVGAAAAVDLNDDVRMQTIDMDLSIVVAMLADLVLHGLLTQAQSDALVALKVTTIPWWQSAGYSSSISDNDLIAAGGLL